MNYDTKYQETGQICGIRQDNAMDAFNACAKQAKAPQIGVSIERLEKACEELRMQLAALGERLNPVCSPVNATGVGQEGTAVTPRSPLTNKIDSIHDRVMEMVRATHNQIDALEI